jgi:hypothetical protein
VTATNELLDFDHDLCDYLHGQIRPHLRLLPVRPGTPDELNYDGFHQLDLSAWLGRVVAGLPASLADHIRVGVHGEPILRSLDDVELNAITLALADPPLRCESEAVWTPFPALHRRAVMCVPVIAVTLTRQTAEEWAIDCSRFATLLNQNELPLAAGVGIIWDWLRRVRQLRWAIESPVTGPAFNARRSSRSGYRRSARLAEGDQPPDMLTPGVVAKQYSVSRSTLYAACRTGQLPHYRVPARKGGWGKYLFRSADVLHWLDALRIGGAGGSATPSASASAPASWRPAPALPSAFSELNLARLARAWAGG